MTVRTSSSRCRETACASTYMARVSSSSATGSVSSGRGASPPPPPPSLVVPLTPCLLSLFADRRPAAAAASRQGPSPWKTSRAYSARGPVFQPNPGCSFRSEAPRLRPPRREAAREGERTWSYPGEARSSCRRGRGSGGRRHGAGAGADGPHRRAVRHVRPLPRHQRPECRRRRAAGGAGFRRRGPRPQRGDPAGRPPEQGRCGRERRAAMVRPEAWTRSSTSTTAPSPWRSTGWRGRRTRST